MIRNYFRVIHITVEKTFIWNTLPAHVTGTSPEGPLKVLTSETYKEPSGNSQGTNTKTDDFMKKMFFRCNYILVLHICFCFLQEEKIFKISKRGCLRDQVAGRPWDQMMVCSKDVPGPSLGSLN